jgi:thymidylate kinase
LIIAIIGPDGSGKSTIADMVVEALNADGFRARHYAMRFGVLPPLSAFRLGGSAPAGPRPESTGRESGQRYDLSENPPLRALVYVTWYGLDYMLGGILLRTKNLLPCGQNVAVFARYFYDYYYQSNNRRLPDRVKRLIEFMVPRPKHIFFLDRDAQEIHDGKPELPVAEIRNQQRIIYDRLAAYPQFHRVDARLGADLTAKRILRVITSMEV